MNGILVVNKPLGYTSRDIVNIVSGIYHTKKVGHTGTLDPNASGVLILCMGNALKVCELMDSFEKEYIAEVILGISTDTLDMDSNATILKEEMVNISDNLIFEAINSFKGKYMQEVPIYSSVKVNGKRLYEYARNNIPVDLPKREVEIKNIEFVDNIQQKNGKVHFKIKVSVSKGTYIRALIRDIGMKLGVPAVMNNLVRTKVGPFDINMAYSLDDIRADKYSLISILDAFPNIKKIAVDEDTTFKIRNGVILKNLFNERMAFILDKDENLLALYENINGNCKPYKMFI